MMRKKIAFRLALTALLWQLAANSVAGNIRSFGADSMAHILATQKGRPFVLFIWSLDCAYCQASLQTLAAAKRMNGLQVVTMATDRADEAGNAAAIEQKLQAAGLRSDAWAFGPVAPERLRYVIDPGWRGEVPRSYWFAADGARTVYRGLITSDVIKDRLTEK